MCRSGRRGRHPECGLLDLCRFGSQVDLGLLWHFCSLVAVVPRQWHNTLGITLQAQRQLAFESKKNGSQNPESLGYLDLAG